MRDPKELELPAILGGSKLNSKTFEWNSLIGEEEKKQVLEVLDSKVLSDFYGSPGSRFLGGKKVKEFEQRWSERFNVKHVVSMNSATSCLHAAMIAIGLRHGDEVLVPPVTMSASVMAVVAVGAKPIFVDIEDDYYCIDASKLESSITEKTRAIVVVDLFGQPANYSQILPIAKKYNLRIIEDCAQAPGAIWNGKYAGTIGDIGVYSLNCHKAIQTGEGGVAVTNDPDLALRMQLIRNHGEAVVEGINFPDPEVFGYNFRLTELQAAIGIPQLTKLDLVNEYKQERAEWLRDELSKYDFLQIPKIREACSHVYYLYVLKYDPAILGLTRDQFVTALNAEGYSASFGYVKPLYLLPYFKSKEKEYGEVRCPTAERLHFKEIFYPNLIRYKTERNDIRVFSEAIDRVAKNAARIAKI